MPHEVQHRPHKGYRVLQLNDAFWRKRTRLAKLQQHGPHQFMHDDNRNRAHLASIPTQKCLVGEHDPR